MIDANSLANLLKLLHLDIRLEVVLANLVSENMSLDELLILNKSLFQRNYHNDIEKIEVQEYGKAGRKRLCFTVNRSGLYDNLPEDVFHQLSDARPNADKERVIKEIKTQDAMESAARKFFIPYEQEFYRQRIKLEIEERKYLFETNSDISDELFAELWGFPDFLDKLQKSKLGILMPIINRMAGDRVLTAFIFENITDDKVEIVETRPLSFTALNTSALGQSILGVDAVLGGEMTDLHRSQTLKIGLKNAKNLTDYLPGGKKNKIYEFLCNLLIPLENDIVFELSFEEKIDFELDNGNLNAARLNYTTII